MEAKYNITKPPAITEEERAKLTISCRDCDPLPKHPLAGEQLVDPDGGVWQIMHNGLLVEYGGYYGQWMADLIKGLRGHHEPQEELLFHLVMQRLKGKPTMIELGAFWAYYSLWFKKTHPNGHCYVFEPDSAHLDVGRRNFDRNRITGYFELAAAGLDGTATIFCESIGQTLNIKSKSVDTIFAEQSLDFLDVLHMDIQGSELAALMGARQTISEKKLRFVVVSTHHHLISGDPLTHQKCLCWLKENGAHIICEHTVHESFSGDGLILASFGAEDHGWTVEVSRARASCSLFREHAYDLADLMFKTS